MARETSGSGVVHLVRIKVGEGSRAADARDPWVSDVGAWAATADVRGEEWVALACAAADADGPRPTTWGEHGKGEGPGRLGLGPVGQGRLVGSAVGPAAHAGRREKGRGRLWACCKVKQTKDGEGKKKKKRSFFKFQKGF